MEKIFLVAITLITLSVNPLQAQRFYGGVMGGFNGSQVEGDMAYGYHKLGAVLGAGGYRPGRTTIRKHGSEIQRKGSRIVPSKKNDYWKYIYRLNYAELPLLLGYRYNEKTQAYLQDFRLTYLIYRYGETTGVSIQNSSTWN